MLANIKSIFFSRNIFTFINERRKLNIIKYNKSLQKLINISIINYKIFKGKIIIRETKEEKEKWSIINAINNDIICEGEYLKGKKNGIGKEYYKDGKLKFEGEYLNEKRHGIGKEYFPNGKLFSEGEYLNGKKWNIKEYDKNGNIINELKNGKGYLKLYNKYNNLIFEGEFINGIQNGKGKEYYDNGILKYEGEYIHGLRNGKGKRYHTNGKIHYEAEYLFGKVWNIKEYDINNNIINELKEGKGYIKLYNKNNILLKEYEYR